LRLGAGPKGFENIKRQEFFKPLDWVKLLKKELTPPFVPLVKDAADTSFVSKEILVESVKETYEEAETALGDGDKVSLKFVKQIFARKICRAYMFCALSFSQPTISPLFGFLFSSNNGYVIVPRLRSCQGEFANFAYHPTE